MKKQKTPAQLKKDLDKIFSIYIRAKYPASCYTCRVRKPNLQCGHFISRSYLITRWNENNCRPQCAGCNIFGSGKPLDFEERLKNDLGDAIVEEMKMSRHKIVKLSPSWYMEEIAKYKDLVAGLQGYNPVV